MKASKTRQRIVHIITCLATGGTSMMLYKLLTHADADQFDHIVISLDSTTGIGEQLQEKGFAVHYLNMKRSLGSSWHILRLANLLRQLKPDIINGWHYHGNLAATLANRLLGDRYPLLWNIQRGIYDLEQESFTTRQMIQWCARLSKKPSCITYNAYASAQQHEAIGYMTAKTQMIPNGFDTQQFYPNQQSREHLRQQLGIPQDAVVIGMVARYHPVKNHELFLGAARFIHQHFPNVHFILAGQQVTNENPELTTQCLKHGLDSRLHLLGEYKDIPSLLNTFDIFSLTASAGALPSIIGEAMACGIPCISTDVGDIARLIGNTGQVIKNPTPSQLAFAWLEWMDAGNIWRTELGQRAAERIQQHYNIHNTSAQYQDIYKELVNVRTNGILHPSESANANEYAGQSAPHDEQPDPPRAE